MRETVQADSSQFVVSDITLVFVLEETRKNTSLDVFSGLKNSFIWNKVIT